MSRVTLLHGDALHHLRSLPDASVDALVTDPPAGVEFDGSWEQTFMGHGFSDGGDRLPAPNVGVSTRNPTCAGCGKRARTWKGGPPACACTSPAFPSDALRLRGVFVEAMTPIFAETLRVLKPGGHALVWALPRTQHWTAVAVEDAGFEVRDVINHLFLTGFPKSKGQLKPAHECWILARKPFSGTVAANVVAYGTGAINIDGCRVATVAGDEVATHSKSAEAAGGNGIFGRYGGLETHQTEGQKLGRWPPNTLFSHHPECQRTGTKTVKALSGIKPDAIGSDYGIHKSGSMAGAKRTIFTHTHASADGTEVVAAWACVPGCPVAALDAQSGTIKATAAGRKASSGFPGGGYDGEYYVPYGDTGGASRMFPNFGWDDEGDDPALFQYAPKAGKKEREAGLHSEEGRSNPHPTVKSLDLMRWLCTLVTPLGGAVLDPFMGSGSTGCAAVQLGFHFIGIEREVEYVEVARQRIAYWANRREHDGR